MPSRMKSLWFILACLFAIVTPALGQESHAHAALYARADGERLRALYDAQLAWAALEKAAGGRLSP